MTNTDYMKAVKNLYEDLCKIHLDNDYSWNVEKESSFDVETYKEVLNRIEHPSLLFKKASSPWEAAIYLIDKQAKTGFIKNVPQLKIGEKRNTTNYKIIHRGQKAKYSNLQPKAWRKNSWVDAGTTPDRANNYHAAFCLLVKLATENNVQISLQSSLYMAAAQHYQIPTELLDWTVDPAISIWFTHLGDWNKGDSGQVFSSELELLHGTELVLPPPFVSRIYRQRGVFHYTTSRFENNNLYLNSEKIFFPLDSEFGIPKSYPFSEAKLLEESAFFSDVKKKALEIANDASPDYFTFLELDKSEEEIAAGIKEARSEYLDHAVEVLLGEYQFPKVWWEANLREWVTSINEYINLIGSFNSESDQSLVSFSTMDKILERNRDLMNLYLNWFLDYAPEEIRKEREDFHKQMLEKLYQLYPYLRKRGITKIQ